MSIPIQWAALSPRPLLEQLRASGAASPAEPLAQAEAATPTAPASPARPLALSDPGQPPQRLPAAPGAHPGTRAEVSPDSRLLARLAAAPLAGEERGKAVPATLLALVEAPGEGFARELRTSFERSGLFYEAHLRAWNAGAFSLSDLRLEPQARIGAAQPALLAAPGAAQPALLAAPGSAPPPGAEALPETAQRAAVQAADAPAHRPAVAPELEPLVREQLATLESRVAVVPLVVWPGQSALLEVGEEPSGARGGDDAAGPLPWRATLALDLPRLGELRFALTLQGEALRIRAEASRAASRAELRAAAPALRAALRAGALRLEALDLPGDGS
jgi:hypothetical protein